MCIACATPVDVTRQDAFAERLLSILNHGALALMISEGHRTGLFDALGDGEPLDAAGLAAKAGL